MRRLGFLDLALALLVAGAVWTRTPTGGLIERLGRGALGWGADLPPLTSYFQTGPLPEVVVALAERALLPEIGPATPRAPEAAPERGLPEPYRTAARLTLGAELTPEVEARLDALYEGTPGDPEAALEALALGADLRDRAIARARSAGEARPESFAAHRPWLPDREARLADRWVAGTLALATVLDLRWPLLASHRITSGFGYRTHPTLGTRKFHDGVDLGVPEGTSVYAAQSGSVRSAGEDRVSGRFVVLDHGNGVRSTYCHLSERLVSKGDRVEAGGEIAKSGNTGRSTGPHLHFSVRIGKESVDPARLRREPEV